MKFLVLIVICIAPLAIFAGEKDSTATHDSLVTVSVRDTLHLSQAELDKRIQGLLYQQDQHQQQATAAQQQVIALEGAIQTLRALKGDTTLMRQKKIKPKGK